MLCCAVVHAADLANVSRPYELAAKWAALHAEEQYVLFVSLSRARVLVSVAVALLLLLARSVCLCAHARACVRLALTGCRCECRWRQGDTEKTLGVPVSLMCERRGSPAEITQAIGAMQVSLTHTLSLVCPCLVSLAPTRPLCLDLSFSPPPPPLFRAPAHTHTHAHDLFLPLAHILLRYVSLIYMSAM